MKSHFMTQNLGQQSRENVNYLSNFRSDQVDGNAHLENSIKIDEMAPGSKYKYQQDKASSIKKVNSFLGTNTLSSKGCMLSEEDNEHGASFKMAGLEGNELNKNTNMIGKCS